MSRRSSIVVASGLSLTMLALAAPGAGGYPRPGSTRRVSVSSSGAEATYVAPVARTDGSFSLDLSANGRFVAFDSDAVDLVPTDTNLAQDVFVHDLKTGSTEIVSVSSHGTPGLGCGISLDGLRPGVGYAQNPSISADGRFVTFESTFCNLVVGDLNMVSDIFVHDRKLGSTSRVSVSSAEEQGLAPAVFPAISGNGRFVSFEGQSENLVPKDDNEMPDIFVRDLKKGKTERASVASGGPEGPGASICSSMNGSGRFVAFDTMSPLTGQDANSAFDVYVHDRLKKKTTLVSMNRSGAAAGGPSRLGCNASDISSDGRYVSFTDSSLGHVPNDSVNTLDVFVRDLKRARTERVSVSSAGEQGGSEFATSISADGRFSVFTSRYNAFDRRDAHDWPIPTLGDPDVYIYDRFTGALELLSVTDDGVEAKTCPNPGAIYPHLDAEASISDFPSVSASGEVVAFTSCASNLARNDTNGGSDIFVRHRGGNLDAGPAGSGRGTVKLDQERSFVQAGFVLTADAKGDVQHDAESADLVGLRLAHRPELEDIFVSIEVDRMASAVETATGLRDIPWYGVRFEAGGDAYEVWAGPSELTPRGSEGGIWLHACDGDHCSPVSPLRGGIGTTGESVALQIPLSDVGLQGGGTLSDVEAITATGSPLDPQVIDRLKIN